MEKFYRTKSELKDTKDYIFQPVEWHVADETRDNDYDEFVIRSFGVDHFGNSVCLTIDGYKPSFYIKVPNSWRKTHFLTFMDKLKSVKDNGKNVINYYVRDGIILNECIFETKKEFYGFTNGRKFKFIQLVFHSMKSMKGYMYGIKKLTTESYTNKKHLFIREISLYETNVEPLLKFYHQTDIQPSNWIKVKNVFKEAQESSTCQLNLQCDWEDIHYHQKEGNANFLQASYDIETYSKPIVDEEGKEYYPFPIPEKESNVIYQIATCFKRLHDNDFLVKHLLTLKKTEEIREDNVVVWECEDEKDLLLKWKRLIELMDPDILYQYNGDMFDCNYMSIRTKMLNIEDKFLEVSRLLDYPAQLKDSTFSSSAYGTENYKRLVIPGRINFDILIFIKREFKENSYKLDSIAEKYVGLNKLDVTPVDIFKSYETGTPENIKKIGLYCINDTVLPQRLVDTLHILQTQISMSNVTFVPVKYLIERGQQIKALSQISKLANLKGYLIPNMEYSADDGEKFQGATVLEPIPGVYDNPITTLDFASLYPSIIRAHNLCYTSIVLNREYDDIQGIEYSEFIIDQGEEAPELKVRYAQDTESILPDLLADLAVQRKKYKKLMAQETEPLLKEIYNKTQLAYKVSMNSVYGILGSNTIGCKRIAATVTRVGRMMIEDTKSYIESHHHNIYPRGLESNILEEDQEIQIRLKDKEKKVKVKELNNISSLEGLEILTTEGWRKMQKIEEIRD